MKGESRPTFVGIRRGKSFMTCHGANIAHSQIIMLSPDTIRSGERREKEKKGLAAYATGFPLRASNKFELLIGASFMYVPGCER